MNNNVRRVVRVAGAIALLCADAVVAATITIDNVDDPGVGFNDPTVVAAIGGTPPNPGTTLGQQRLNVFNQAASQWGALLKSNVTIVVQASMPDTLACTATSATLGSAGPLLIAAAFPNAPRMNTSYNIAEANSIAGFDLDSGASDDIHAQFNSKLDQGLASCLGGEKWWYGLDPSVSPPGGTIPLLPVVFHELGHGLGFTSNVDDSGNFFTADTPVWADYLFDIGTSKLWKNMTNVERVASAIADPNLVWTGPRTNKQAGAWLKANNALIINSPAALTGPQEVGVATFGPSAPASGVSGDFVLVNDGVSGVGTPSGTPTDGCESPFVNAASVNGKIAVMDRGFCNFTVKVKNAQTAGAIAAIIVNNAVDGLRLPLTLSGSDATITIPSYSVTQALGLLIEADLPAPGVNAKLGYANIGINEGCVRMFAPNPLLGGSSVSHFHADAFPNLLMEPALNTSIFNKVDLTLPLFNDIDWKTNLEDFIFLDGLDPNPCQHVQQ